MSILDITTYRDAALTLTTVFEILYLQDLSEYVRRINDNEYRLYELEEIESLYSLSLAGHKLSWQL